MGKQRTGWNHHKQTMLHPCLFPITTTLKPGKMQQRPKCQQLLFEPLEQAKAASGQAGPEHHYSEQSRFSCMCTLSATQKGSPYHPHPPIHSLCSHTVACPKVVGIAADVEEPRRVFTRHPNCRSRIQPIQHDYRLNFHFIYDYIPCHWRQHIVFPQKASRSFVIAYIACQAHNP